MSNPTPGRRPVVDCRRDHARAATHLPGHVGLSVLLGWVVTAAVFVARTWAHLWPLAADDTARHATREDPTRATTHAIIVVAAVASAVGVAFVFFSTGVSDRALSAGGGDPQGGIDFHQDEPPRYSDFAYVAYTVGMSYAISDTDLQSSAMRRVAIGHALLSYLFGTVILAALINLVAGL